MANIIIPGKKIAQTRSEQAEIIRKEWGGHGGLTDTQIDKCKHLEKKIRDKYGRGAENYFRACDIDDVR